MERLERHFALEGQITRAPYGTERSTAEGRKYLVVVAYRPADASFRRILCRCIWLAAHHHHRSRRISSIDRAQQHGKREESISGVGREGAIDSLGEHFRRFGPDPFDWRYLARGRRFS